MLSISGVSNNAGVSYYEKEDYYFKGQAGEVVLGREQYGEKMSREQFENLVQERISQTGGDVEKRDKVAEDLTFSAPKSVSLVAALDKDQRENIFKAHQEAVQKVMEYIQQSGMIQTREKGKPARAENIVAVRFDHFTNRNGDPQLHSHTLILNRVQDTNGELRATYLKEIYQNKIALGTLYRQELASNLEKLGYQTEWRKDGTFELKGFTREQLEKFSSRRQEIEHAMKERGLEGGKAAEVAALDTRHAKQEYDIQKMEQTWQKTAREVGISIPKPELKPELKEQTQEKEIRAIRAIDVKNLVEEATQKQIETAGFTQMHRVELDVAKTLAKEGITANIKEIKELAKKGLKYMQERDNGLQFLGKDHVGREYITTQDVLHAELRSREEPQQERPGLDKQKTQEILNKFNENLQKTKGFQLDQYQTQAVEKISTSNRDGIIVGKAGAGKTTIMEAFREVYKQQGKAVIGAAPTGAAAHNLEKEAGIKSFTVDSLCFQEQMDKAQLKGGLLIVDEAGMLDAKRDAAISEFAEKYEMKVLRVGDPDQIKPVGHGDPFAQKIDEEMNRAESSPLQKSLQEILKKYQDKQQEINAQLKKFYDEYGGGDKYSAIKTNEEGYKILREKIKMEHEKNEYNFIDNLESALTKSSGSIEHQQKLREILDSYKDARAALAEYKISGRTEVERAKEREKIAEQYRDIEQNLVQGVRNIIKDKKYENLVILDKIYRQKEEKYRDVTLKAAIGKTVESLEQAKKNGWVKEITARGERIQAAAKEYLEDRKNGKNTLLVTESNFLKNKLNKEIRYILKKEGVLSKEDGIKIETRGTDGKKTGEREFVKGDVIQFTRNDKQIGIMNGQIGQIQEIDTQKNIMSVKVGDEIKKLNYLKYNYIDYGYATTIHKSQGQTVDRVIYVHDAKKSASMTTQNLYYVAISRGREGMTIYTDSFDKMKERVSQAQQKKDVLIWQAKNVTGKSEDKDIKKEDLKNTVDQEKYAQFSAQEKIKDGIIESAARQTWYDMDKAEKQEVLNNLLRDTVLEQKARNALEKTGEWYPEQIELKDVKATTKKIQKSAFSTIIEQFDFKKQYYNALRTGENVKTWGFFLGKDAVDIKKDQQALKLANSDKGLLSIHIQCGKEMADKVRAIRAGRAEKQGNVKEAWKYGGLNSAISAGINKGVDKVVDKTAEGIRKIGEGIIKTEVKLVEHLTEKLEQIQEKIKDDKQFQVEKQGKEQGKLEQINEKLEQIQEKMEQKEGKEQEIEIQKEEKEIEKDDIKEKLDEISEKLEQIQEKMEKEEEKEQEQEKENKEEQEVEEQKEEKDVEKETQEEEQEQEEEKGEDVEKDVEQDVEEDVEKDTAGEEEEQKEEEQEEEIEMEME